MRVAFYIAADLHWPFNLVLETWTNLVNETVHGCYRLDLQFIVVL